MSHFEFAIPLQRDELLNPATGEYRVEEVLPVESVPVSIKSKIKNNQTYLSTHKL